MIVVNANSLSSLSIGRHGENLARQVVFDVSDWEAEYGHGVVELIAQRPGDEKPYPVAVKRDGTQVIWNITSVDSAIVTHEHPGKCELRYYVGEVLAKSKTWRLWVDQAMDTPSETAPPDPEKGWVDQIIAVGAAAKASADAAKADADRAATLAAEVAVNAAQTAQDASDAAKAMDAAQTAQRLAEEAQGAAETARTAAETAQAAAEQSATDAAGAKQDAETALKSAQDAAAAAAKALEDIRALYQEMQTWAQGVIRDVNDAGSAAVQSVQTAGDAQVQRVTAEGTTQTANAKAQANAAAQSAADAAQSAQQAEESAAVYDTVVADVTQLKQDLTGLQTVVDSKADKSELAKTNLYLDALYKLNKGQTYDVLEQESEAYSVDVPSGAKYVGIDKVGGKSVVWNQKFDILKTYTTAFDGNREVIDNKIVYKSKASVPANRNLIQFFNNSTNDGHKYYASAKVTNNSEQSIPIKWLMNINNLMMAVSIKPNETALVRDIKSYNYTLGIRLQRDNAAQATDELVFEDIMFYDLTQMFGAGNEPTIEEFEAMFPADYYPYSDPTIISSQTDRVEMASADGTITQQIPTGFPVLNSAGSVYDYIDLNEGKLHQRVGKVDLGTLTYSNGGSLKMFFSSSIKDVIKKPASNNDIAEIISDSFSPISYNAISFGTVGCICVSNIGSVGIVDGNRYDTVNDFKSVMSGVMLYYELAEEIITDITIPTELTDWLTVEAGGSITFHNTDDGKRLLIPNKLSFVRKLDEVTV